MAGQPNRSKSMSSSSSSSTTFFLSSPPPTSDGRSAEQIEIHVFFLFLLDDLLLVFAAAATAATAAAHDDQCIHAHIIDHLRHERWPIALHGATCSLDQIDHGIGDDFSTVVMEDQSGICAEELVLLLLGQ